MMTEAEKSILVKRYHDEYDYLSKPHMIRYDMGKSEMTMFELWNGNIPLLRLCQNISEVMIVMNLNGFRIGKYLKDKSVIKDILKTRIWTLEKI